MEIKSELKHFIGGSKRMDRRRSLPIWFISTKGVYTSAEGA
jgi:hypothetical protein